MFVPQPEHRLAREQLSARPSLPPAVDKQEPKYHSYHQLGNHFKQGGHSVLALAEYQQAIHELERLRAQLTIKQRADFLADKQMIYEEMVDLCLELQQPAQALAYAELVKSRMLADLMAMPRNLKAQGENPPDRPWVAALRHLWQARDQFIDAWQEPGEAHLRGGAPPRSRTPAKPQVSVLPSIVMEAEQWLADLWGSVHTRHSHPTQKIISSSTSTEAVQACLEPGTALVEYFVINGRFVAFVVTTERIYVQRLPGTLPQVHQLLRFLQLNLKTVAHGAPSQLENLTRNANQLLQSLYKLLFAPLRDALAAYTRLIIVPHGPLHQLAFAALYDGQAYLIEQYEISYLPRAGLLPHCTQAQARTSTTKAMVAMTFGYSVGGQLPHATQEAQQVALLTNGQAFLEEAATTAQVRKVAAQCRLLHLATHGNFRADNPLFSGLALADGWLTTLDVFDLHLQASLVTLSACQTGCHVIADGDELLGLMRAFLVSGTASLVACLWAVEDQATEQFMTHFYQKLANGLTKGAALRATQIYLLHSQARQDSNGSATYAHPYFWAPFFLVGASGLL